MKIYHSLLCSMILISGAVAGTITTTSSFDKYGRVLASDPFGRSSTKGVHTVDTSTISDQYDTAVTSTTVNKRIDLFKNESTWSAQHCVNRKTTTLTYDASTTAGGLKWYTKSVAGFNGALTTYKYNRSANGALEVITRSGVDKDGNGTVDSGTQTTTQTNQYGYLVSAVSKDIRSGAILSSRIAVAKKFTSWGQPKCFKTLNGLTTEVEIDENSGLVTSATDALGSTTTFEHKSLYGATTKATRAGITTTLDVSNPLVTSSSITGAGLSERKSATTVDKLGRALAGESSITGYPSATNKWNVNNHLGGSTQSQFGRETTNKVDASGDHDSVTGNSVATPNNKQTREFIGGYFVINNNLTSAKNPYKSVIKMDALGRVRITETPSVDSTSPSAKTVHKTTYTYHGAGKVKVKVAGPDKTNTLTISDPFLDDKGATQVAETRSGIDFNGDDSLTDQVDRFSVNRSEIKKATGGHASIYTKSSTLAKEGVSNHLSSTYDVKSEQTTTNLNDEETISQSIDYVAKKTTSESSVNGSSVSDFDHNGLTIKNTTTAVGLPTSESTLKRRLDGSLDSSKKKIGSSESSGAYNEIGFPKGDFISPYITTTIKDYGFGLNGDFKMRTDDGTGEQTTTESANQLEQSASGANKIDRQQELILTDHRVSLLLKPQEAGGKHTKTTYNAAGLFEEKAYSVNGSSVNQTASSASYFPHGGLKDYIDARGKKTTRKFSNDPLKDLTEIRYPLIYDNYDVDEPKQSSDYSYRHVYSYRRSDGKIKSISDLSGLRELDYSKNRNIEQIYSSGELSGVRIDRHFDSYGRLSRCSLYLDAYLLHSSTISYNGLSEQITSITDDDEKEASYSYSENLLQMDKLTRGALIQNYQRETDGRLISANAKVGSLITAISRHDYNSFDSRSRRKTVATSGGSWRYDYDANGNLISATHPEYGDFIYTYDGMGRRLSSSAHSSYSLNEDLNQPTGDYSAQRYMNLWIDSANLTNLTVNNQSLINTGFRKYKIPVTGTSDEGRYMPYTVRGVLPSAGQERANPDAVAEVSGFAYVKPNQTSISYDEEGNRATDSLWDYSYDARNNLIQLTSKEFSQNTSLPGKKINYSYDSEGRRFKKITTTRTLKGNTTTETTTTTWFVWDEWKLLYEVQVEGAQTEIDSGKRLYQRFYTWGLDTDGSKGGLGHVGGLLNYREQKGEQTETYYPTYDAQGNVTALVRARDNEVVAEYVYGPFGELIKAEGSKAASNPWRFATKYQDEESGFHYFGYRYYDANTGAWLSREPLGENESINLYSYCHNDPVNNVDYLGLYTKLVTLADGSLKSIRRHDGTLQVAVHEVSGWNDKVGPQEWMDASKALHGRGYRRHGDRADGSPLFVPDNGSYWNPPSPGPTVVADPLILAIINDPVETFSAIGVVTKQGIENSAERGTNEFIAVQRSQGTFAATVLAITRPLGGADVATGFIGSEVDYSGSNGFENYVSRELTTKERFQRVGTGVLQGSGVGAAIVKVGKNTVLRNTSRKLVAPNTGPRQLTEADYLKRIEMLEQHFGASGVHSLQRHGAQTSLLSQYRRVARSNYPDPTTGLRSARTKDATKFLSHKDHYRALRSALVQRKKLGLVDDDIMVGFNHNIGIGVRNLGSHRNRGPYNIFYQQNAVIRFDEHGKFFTAFPKP